jgi:hypothetical protein
MAKSILPESDAGTTGRAACALPWYIIERNERAAAAGLTIEKQRINRDGTLTTWYRGSAAQIAASGLVAHGGRFTPPRRIGGRTGWNAFLAYSPGHAFACHQGTASRLGADDFRLVFVKERLPVSVDLRPDGIEAYVFAPGELVYVAPLPALIAAGIAPPEAEERRALRADPLDWSSPILWESHPLDDGRHRFARPRNAAQLEAKYHKDRSRVVFSHPDEYRAYLGQLVNGLSDIVLNCYGEVLTRHGRIYRLSERARRDVRDLIERAEAVLHGAEVHVFREDARTDEERAEVRQQVASMAADTAFQRFLRSIPGGNGGGA